MKVDSIYVFLVDQMAWDDTKAAKEIHTSQDWNDMVTDQKKLRVFTIAFIIDGGGAVIAVGEHGHLRIPIDCTIERVTLLADQTGSIKIDIWKDTYANFPPTNADTITGGNEPEIVAGIKDEDSTLTNWTTTIDADDILAYNVDSCATIQRVTVMLKVRRLNL